MKKLLAFVSLLVAFTAGTSSAAVSNDELKIGISQEFENLNPLVMQMSATVYMYGLTGRPLDVIDANGKWIPMLAKKIPRLEDGSAKLSPDKKHVVAVWELRDNAKWSDGKPVVCEDFALAREIAMSPNVSVGDKTVYSQVEKIDWDKANPKKCTFTYDKPRWDFYMLGTFYPVPAHIEADVFKKFGSQKEGYEKNSNYVRNPSMPGLYTGPYQIAEVKLGSHATFIANPYYYGKAPKIKKIVIKLIPNTSTMEANVRSGTIDAISTIGVTFDQAIALDKKSKSENLPFQVDFKPSLVYEHVDLNLDNPILKDVKVRKALLYGLNREELVKALFDNRQKVALHFNPPMDPWYVSDPKKITIYNYSRREASRLLDEAGWKLDSKDNYRYKDGKKLSFTFQTTAGDKTRETVQTFLQNQWKAVGIEVVIKNEPARVFFSQTMSKREFPALAMYAWTSSPENNPRAQVHSASIPSQKNGWSGQNYPGWSNKRVDELVDKLDSELDAKKRLELITEITKIYTDELPVLPLYYRTDVAVTPKILQHFAMTGHQFYETFEAENWDLK